MKQQSKKIAILILFTVGVSLLGQGSYIKLKAEVANWLISSSWAGAEAGTTPSKPWPWADTWIVARLRVPRLDVDEFIMKDSSGESLAFGAGSVIQNAIPASDAASLIAGHRDTHFSFMSDLVAGDQIEVENYLGQRKIYRVINSKLFDTRTGSLQLDTENAGLTLATCWPFNAVIPGGPLRYLVYALPAATVDERISSTQSDVLTSI